MITMFRRLLRRFFTRPVTVPVVASDRRIITRPHVVVLAVHPGRTADETQARAIAQLSQPLLVRCLSCERLAPLEELVRGRCEDCQ